MLAENDFLDAPTMEPSEDFFRGIEAGQTKLKELTSGGILIDGKIKPEGPTDMITQRAVTGGAFRASAGQSPAPAETPGANPAATANANTPRVSSSEKHEAAASRDLLRSASSPGLGNDQQARNILQANAQQAKADLARANQDTEAARGRPGRPAGRPHPGDQTTMSTLSPGCGRFAYLRTK